MVCRGEESVCGGVHGQLWLVRCRAAASLVDGDDVVQKKDGTAREEHGVLMDDMTTIILMAGSG